MISAIIIDPDPNGQKTLRNQLFEYCPYIEIKGSAETLCQARQLPGSSDSELLFFNPQAGEKALEELQQFYDSHQFETIILACGEEAPAENRLDYVAGRLLKPFPILELILAVNTALNRILEKRKSRQAKLIQKFFKIHALDETVGIPTMEGFEFIPVNQIIRCEGLQKCTRVVACSQSDIISSYNLGEFKKLLAPFHFFSPHKSHLINLNKVRKYYKEGTIQMQDGSHVPVARRRKDAFLQVINRL